MAKHRGSNFRTTRTRGRGRNSQPRSPRPAPSVRPKEDFYRVNSSAELGIEYSPSLLHRHPQLMSKIPWVSLRGVEEPSAPKRFQKSQHLFGSNYAYWKSEMLDFHVMPENKARKLEFIMGSVLERAKKKIVTYGHMGSFHCFAAVKAASLLGMKSEVVLLKAPMTSEAIQMVAAMKNLGAKVRLRSTRTGVQWLARWHWLCSKIFKTEIIPAGGATALGALGYVGAMIELKHHVDAGILPLPQYLFVPVGTGATLAGLEVGRELLGFSSMKIIGVKTSGDREIDKEKLAHLIQEIRGLLEADVRFEAAIDRSGEHWSILSDFAFEGYGELPIEVQRWISQLQELEEIDLDPAYSSKALFGMSQFIREKNLVNQTILFWNTYTGFRKGDLPSSFAYHKISGKLRRWIREEQTDGKLPEIGRI